MSFLGWVKSAGEWVAASAAALGPFGIFLVALSDSAFIPMPQGVDALLIAQSIAHPETAYLSAALAVTASVLGSLVLYQIARKGGRLLLEKKVSPEAAAKMKNQIEEYGPLVLIPPTMIPLPLPMKLFVIAAGVFQMSRKEFVAALIFARSIRYFGEAWVAVRYGDETVDFLRENAVITIVGGLLLVGLFFAVHHWSTHRVTGEKNAA